MCDVVVIEEDTHLISHSYTSLKKEILSALTKNGEGHKFIWKTVHNANEFKEHR